MKTPDDNKLDRLFREGLNKPDGNAGFREDDWEAVEALLDQKTQKSDKVLWLYWLTGSVAAALIVFFGWALLRPVAIIKNNNHITKNQNSNKTNADRAAEQKDSADIAVKQNIQLTQLPSNKTKIYSDKSSMEAKNKGTVSINAADRKMKIASVNKTYLSANRYKRNIDKKVNISSINEAFKQKQNEILPKENASTSSQFYAGKRSIDTNAIELAAVEAKNNFADNSTSLNLIPVATNLMAKIKPPNQTDKTKKVKQNMPPRFSLAILSAPDLNGVNSFTGTRVGANAGLQLSVQLTRKLSINTGAVYAAKPYEIDMAQYQTSATFSGKPGEVDANCKVLDVPFNLNYQVFSKNRNSFTAGAGLSSYFMLRENYNFYYTDNTSYYHNIVNQNKHILGVLNLNATYQRRINPEFSLLVQPYLKLPLTPIGYERIGLQSAGLSVGVGWNINSLKTSKK